MRLSRPTLLSRPTFKKLQWLVSHPRFRAKPIVTLMRVAFWEYIRLRRSTVTISFDQDLEVVCRWNDGTGRLLYYFGTYFDGTISILDKILSHGMTFVDVGANIGTHSLFAAKRVGNTGNVISFEPDPNVFDVLKLNTQGFPNVEIYNLAVSSTDGSVCFYMNADTAKSSLVRRGGAIKTIRVSASILDDKLKGKVDVVKVDVEGHELSVVEGASRLLRENAIKCLIFECSENKTDIFALLKEFGYHVFGIRSSGSITEEIHQPENMMFNCLAAHDAMWLYEKTKS